MADNELYKAISTIGPQLEAELTGFGLCAEECFMETQELLSDIADKGKDVLLEIDNIWYRKYNEYRRFDRQVSEDETRKAVGIVIGFTILAIDSSKHPFYRYTLPPRLTSVLSDHQFDGWLSTLERIFSVPLPDGWFDAFIEEEPQDGNAIVLPKELDTPRAQKYFAKAIEKKYMERTKEGKYHWLGTNNKGVLVELAYFLGRVYNYENSLNGNLGENFPEKSLDSLFGVNNLYSSLKQAYNAQKPQRWRALIDTIFE